MAMNRNKRGIALNLKLPAAREALKRMVGRADVLTENYRKGTMEKLGLGYEALSPLNPGLIYCSISGYGRTGPYAGRAIRPDRAGHVGPDVDHRRVRPATGEVGRAGLRASMPGCLAALGVVAAYIHRLKTGEGQLVDTCFSRPAFSRPTGSRRSSSPPARRRGRAARRTTFGALPCVPGRRWLAHDRRRQPTRTGSGWCACSARLSGWRTRFRTNATG